MARRSSSRSQRPLWLIVLVAVAGWVYNTYLKPPPPSNRTGSNTTTPRNTPKPRSSGSGSSSNSSGRSTVTAQGGVPFQDRVIKITDGDTVKLAGQGSVRLIGVDCPEKSQPGGPEATAFTAKYLADKDVEVELCAKQPTDRYGRGLAFIYLRQGGRRILFNAELVRQGYARVYSLRPCTVDEAQWNNFYQEARQQKRGLFRTLGEVPDAAAYRKKKRTSLRDNDFRLATLGLSAESASASTCDLW